MSQFLIKTKIMELKMNEQEYNEFMVTRHGNIY